MNTPERTSCGNTAGFQNRNEDQIRTVIADDNHYRLSYSLPILHLFFKDLSIMFQERISHQKKSNGLVNFLLVLIVPHCKQRHSRKTPLSLSLLNTEDDHFLLILISFGLSIFMIIGFGFDFGCICYIWLLRWGKDPAVCDKLGQRP